MIYDWFEKSETSLADWYEKGYADGYKAASAARATKEATMVDAEMVTGSGTGAFHGEKPSLSEIERDEVRSIFRSVLSDRLNALPSWPVQSAIADAEIAAESAANYFRTLR